MIQKWLIYRICCKIFPMTKHQTVNVIAPYCSICVLLCFLMAFSPIFGAPPQVETAISVAESQSGSDLYSQALKALSQKNFDVGVKLYYKALLLKDPVLSVPCRKHDLREAWAYFSEQKRKGSKNPKITFYLSILRRICQDFDKALALLRPLRKQFPTEPFPAFLHGEILFAHQNIADAVKIFHTLAVQPKEIGRAHV